MVTHKIIIIRIEIIIMIIFIKKLPTGPTIAISFPLADSIFIFFKVGGCPYPQLFQYSMKIMK
jgi:hypothetical protein